MVGHQGRLALRHQGHIPHMQVVLVQLVLEMMPHHADLVLMSYTIGRAPRSAPARMFQSTGHAETTTAAASERVLEATLPSSLVEMMERVERILSTAIEASVALEHQLLWCCHLERHN
jgi:hypothetical protein